MTNERGHQWESAITVVAFIPRGRKPTMERLTTSLRKHTHTQVHLSCHEPNLQFRREDSFTYFILSPPRQSPLPRLAGLSFLLPRTGCRQLRFQLLSSAGDALMQTPSFRSRSQRSILETPLLVTQHTL